MPMVVQRSSLVGNPNSGNFYQIICKESSNKKLEGSTKDFTIGLSTDLIEKDLGKAIEL